ncbi:flippase [Chromohalobacter sp. 296-RDG]|uniref:flippase n=1 Tax=Chromohalobacter sp. 296-RDG TaxID=2994062 RepID=UPI0024693ABE|nr:flippase [Chromohalobacter sp. 296-RDG]
MFNFSWLSLKALNKIIALIKNKTKSDFYFRLLFTGGVGTLIVKAIHAILMLLSAAMFARMLGTAGYGVYSFSLAVITICSIPAQAGAPQVVVRETAKANRADIPREIPSVWKWANRNVLLFTTITIFFTSLAIIALKDIISPARFTTLLFGVSLIPLIAFINVKAAALRGLSSVVLAQLPDSIIRPLSLLLIFTGGTFLASYGRTFPPVYLMLAHTLAAAASLTFIFLILKVKVSHFSPSPPLLRKTRDSWNKAALPLAFISAFMLVNKQTDLILLGLLRDDHEVGVYKAVFQIAFLVIFGLQAVNQIIKPYLATLYYENRKAELQRLLTLSSRTIFLLATPPVLAIFFYGPAIITTVFGSGFATGSEALYILVFGQLINAYFGPIDTLLNMTGYEKESLKALSLAILCNLSLNFLLIPSFGIQGAAAATTISLFIWNLSLWYVARTKLKLKASFF